MVKKKEYKTFDPNSRYRKTSVLISQNTQISVTILVHLAIATLFFEGAIQARDGKLTEAGIEKCQQLWHKLRGKWERLNTINSLLTSTEYWETAREMVLLWIV